jgi:hypothetical protein
VLTIVLAIGCAGQGSGIGPANEGPLLANLPPQPLDRVLFLEQAGASPDDTMVTFAANRGRSIAMRHAPPDNAVFAIITVPADPLATDTIVLTLAPMPGRYGLRISAAPRLPAGTDLTFSYAIHFQAPAGALDRYATVSRFARAMGIGRVLEGDRFQFLPERHPATDMLATSVDLPGDYVVAAPR